MVWFEAMKTAFLRAALAIVRKDFQAELRSRELISTMGLFALLSTLIFSFALELDRGARIEVVGGVLWVTVVFASILGLNRSMALEREHGNLDALLIAPISRPAIFFGKLIGNFLFTLVVTLILTGVMTLLYNVSLVQGWMLLALLLGTVGFTTVGTLLATMTVQTRARENLLPILMMPVSLPLLISAVRASNGILANAPQNDWLVWLSALVVIDVIYATVCFLLFEFVVEE
jgi:heme exporter protein B